MYAGYRVRQVWPGCCSGSDTSEVKESADLILTVLEVAHQAGTLLSPVPPRNTTYQIVDVGNNSVDNVKAMSGVVETPHNKCSSHSTNWQVGQTIVVSTHEHEYSM